MLPKDGDTVDVGDLQSKTVFAGYPQTVEEKDAIVKSATKNTITREGIEGTKNTMERRGTKRVEKYYYGRQLA